MEVQPFDFKAPDLTVLYIICLLDVWYLCDLQIFDALNTRMQLLQQTVEMKKPWADFANIKPENKYYDVV